MSTLNEMFRLLMIRLYTQLPVLATSVVPVRWSILFWLPP